MDYDYNCDTKRYHSIDQKALKVSVELHCEHSNEKNDGSTKTQMQFSSWLQLKTGIITSHHEPTKINNEFCRVAKYFIMPFAIYKMAQHFKITSSLPTKHQ